MNGGLVRRSSFEGLTLYPRLARLPEQELTDMLEEPKEEEGPEPIGIVGNIVSAVSFHLRFWG